MQACFSMLFKVPIGMSLLGCGNSYTALRRGMLELFVAADVIDFVPAVTL